MKLPENMGVRGIDDRPVPPRPARALKRQAHRDEWLKSRTFHHAKTFHETRQRRRIHWSLGPRIEWTSEMYPEVSRCAT